MAVPKTIGSRCRDGSVQEREFTQILHKYPHPYNFLIHDIVQWVTLCDYWEQHCVDKKNVEMGLLV